MILSPIPTGQWAELPYCPGYRYVAFKARETDQVNMLVLAKLDKLSILIPKVSTYTHHEARPDALVYLDHDFHIMDLQVVMSN